MRLPQLGLLNNIMNQNTQKPFHCDAALAQARARARSWVAALAAKQQQLWQQAGRIRGARGSRDRAPGRS
jgi:hypothetical protein